MGLRLATGETVTFNCTLIVSPNSELVVWDELMGGNGATRVGRGPLNGKVVGRVGAMRLLLSNTAVVIGATLSAVIFTLPPSRDRSPVLPLVVVDDVLGIRLLLMLLLTTAASPPIKHLDDLSTLLSRLLLPLLPPLRQLSSLLSFRSLMRRLRLVLCIDCDG